MSAKLEPIPEAAAVSSTSNNNDNSGGKTKNFLLDPQIEFPPVRSVSGYLQEARDPGDIEVSAGSYRKKLLTWFMWLFLAILAGLLGGLAVVEVWKSANSEEGTGTATN